jgi:hypothetical protein
MSFMSEVTRRIKLGNLCYCSFINSHCIQNTREEDFKAVILQIVLCDCEMTKERKTGILSRATNGFNLDINGENQCILMSSEWSTNHNIKIASIKS